MDVRSIKAIKNRYDGGGRMKWYTRKDINKQPDRFKGVKFLTEDDFTHLLAKYGEIAVSCGANHEEMMSIFEAAGKGSANEATD